MGNRHGDFIWYELLTSDADAAQSFYGDIDEAVARTKDRGGQIAHEPIEIPGGEFAVNAIDPQGAIFAFVGTRK